MSQKTPVFPSLFRLNAFVSEKIWGYERWIVSTLKNAQSLSDDGTPLSDKISGEYPLLVKVIQANDTLSVQVHPADEYAKKHENSYGKTECWYILGAEKDANLVCGLKKTYTRVELERAIVTDSLDECLYSVPVSTGDFVFIPAGTVHAIQGGLRILEIQQPSDVTYRLYDWGRGRELHVEKSLDVINHAFETQLPVASLPVKNFSGPFNCPYFSVEKCVLPSGGPVPVENADTCFFIIDGSGLISRGGETLPVKKEDVFMALAGEAVRFDGSLTVMKIVPVV